MTRQARHGSAGLELLLDEDVFDGTRMSRVLSAARQPTHAEELVGLGAARAAFISTFEAAHSGRTHTGRSASSRRVAGRFIALKAAAALSGATLVGGVAFAASHANLLNTPTHHQQQQQQAPQASQPGAPQGSALSSTSVSGGHASNPRGHLTGHPAQNQGNKGVASASHAPHPHPTKSAPATPPGQSNPPRRGGAPHTNNGRTTHPSVPPTSQRSATHTPSPGPHLQ